MNLQGLISFAQNLPKGLNPETFFAKLEGEFGRHCGAAKMLKSMFTKWTDGKATMPAAQEIFESLARSGSAAKPAPAQKPAPVAAIVPAPKAQPAAVADQSLASRLGLKEVASCTRLEFNSLSPRQKMDFSKNGGRLSE